LFTEADFEGVLS